MKSKTNVKAGAAMGGAVGVFKPRLSGEGGR